MAREDLFTFLVAGKAGEGVKKAALVAARLFSSMGRHIFGMDDYQSLIRGGHNFSVVSTARRKIMSHYLSADLIVALDKRSYEKHKGGLAEGGVLVYNDDTIEEEEADGIGIRLTTEAKKYPDHALRLGVGSIAILCAVIGFNRDEVTRLIENEYSRDIENNRAYALAVFDMALSLIEKRATLERGDTKRAVISGNEAIGLGAYAGGLDIYFAYPMTPSSSVLHYLAANDEALGITVMHPENEIAAINMAIGAASAGLRSMTGTSGGGFALMEEAFSLAGMTETPLFCLIASRPGPSTGVPTYTSQGDLSFALGAGHGEFPRIVASPGSIEEAFYLSAQMMELAWRFQTPCILLTEKHLAESRMTVEIAPEKVKTSGLPEHKGGEYKRYLDTPDGVSPLLFPPSREVIKWNSYEHNDKGFTTEEEHMIAKMSEKRVTKRDSMVKHLQETNTVNVYGNDGPVIITYGSTTMSVLEALSYGGIKATVIQTAYLEPLPVWELEKYKDREIIIVEQSSTGLFASLLKEKAGIRPRALIKRYDGRPFEPVELAARIKEAL